MLKLSYEPNAIEPKWQKAWKKSGLFRAIDFDKRNKFYALVEFPYPSGDLHMGHWYAFVPPDVYTRYKRMKGYNVLFPIGFDAFGLPAENAAIQRGIHPRDWTYANIKRMTCQFESMGPSFDWERMIITCDTEYYRWNQWIFLKMYKKGLVYRAEVTANWCPKCQTVLANEQVENGKCWRHSDTEVVQKKIPQWLFKITDYAEKLLWPDDPRKRRVSWPQSVIEGQNNWIGKSEGTIIKFQIPNSKFQIPVFTTRPDTLFGATFLVLAPESELALKLATAKYKNQVQKYIEATQKKTELERKESREKTGVFTGSYAINPVNNKKIPIWVADYVLVTYGTGAIMAVPAHDRRDFEFAKKYELEIRQVIRPLGSQDPRSLITQKPNNLNRAYEGDGIIINSGEWNGWEIPKSMGKITKWLGKKGLGKKQVHYHLHDWTISRQRYWGTPIPMIHCPKCARLDPSGQGIVPVPEKDLPVELPYKVDYTPRGKSPLATAPDFVNTICPDCGGTARRDTDTMDTFVDSSWYFLRYVSPHYMKLFADPKLVKYWLPVDIYFGGGEHTLGHTMYARFITRVLHDLGFVPFDEFAKKRIHHGVILGPDGAKMSKSRGNVVNPDGEVKKYGADTVRMYLCFMGPHEAGGPWNPKGIMGIYRFLNKVWELVTLHKDLILTDQKDAKDVLTAQHKLIKRATEDLEALKFNTAIAALMEYVNALRSKLQIINHKSQNRQIRCAEWEDAIKTLLLLLAPFAPHMTEELWQAIGTRQWAKDKNKLVPSAQSPVPNSIHLQSWPTYDYRLTQEEEVTVPIQVNGKLRETLRLRSGQAIKKGVVEKAARDNDKIAKWLRGHRVEKVIFIPGKLINFVTEP